MTYLLNLAYFVVLLAASPVLAYKALTTGKYREGIWDRLAGASPKRGAKPVVWIHAVSVGEVLLLRPLLARFRTDAPAVEVALSVTTSAGYAVAREKYPELRVFFAPLDFSWAVWRVFENLRPDLLVLTELELWPNLLLEAKCRRIPVAVANARLGERSYRGYRRLRPVLRPAFEAIRWWGAQTETYARRIRSLTDGCGGEVVVTGSMKYDGALTDHENPRTIEFRRLLGIQPGDAVLVAGSTQDPEERYLLEIVAPLRDRWPNLKLILAPRHKERFDEVVLMAREKFPEAVRRSEIDSPLPNAAAVTIVDTIGELSAVWGLADIGYVGGSMECNRGGQNMIEPAAFGVAVCFGPLTWNFQDTVDKLLEADAAIVTHDRHELAATIERWLDSPEDALAQGARASRFVATQLGAVDTTFAALTNLLGLRDPAERRIA